jgi:hypothetical protein
MSVHRTKSEMIDHIADFVFAGDGVLNERPAQQQSDGGAHGEAQIFHLSSATATSTFTSAARLASSGGASASAGGPVADHSG